MSRKKCDGIVTERRSGPMGGVRSGLRVEDGGRAGSGDGLERVFSALDPTPPPTTSERPFLSPATPLCPRNSCRQNPRRSSCTAEVGVARRHLLLSADSAVAATALTPGGVLTPPPCPHPSSGHQHRPSISIKSRQSSAATFNSNQRSRHPFHLCAPSMHRTSALSSERPSSRC